MEQTRFTPTYVGLMFDDVELTDPLVRFIPTYVGLSGALEMPAFYMPGSSPHAWGK